MTRRDLVARAAARLRAAGVASPEHDAAELLASAKGKMGPATAADDDWWKGRLRFAK